MRYILKVLFFCNLIIFNISNSFAITKSQILKIGFIDINYIIKSNIYKSIEYKNLVKKYNKYNLIFNKYYFNLFKLKYILLNKKLKYIQYILLKYYINNKINYFYKYINNIKYILYKEKKILYKKILFDIFKVINYYSKKNKYSLILNSDLILFYNKNSIKDITINILSLIKLNKINKT